MAHGHILEIWTTSKIHKMLQCAAHSTESLTFALARIIDNYRANAYDIITLPSVTFMVVKRTLDVVK